jgi:hypothetical protein
MAVNNKSWNDSLDELLAKLNNGDFVDQSVNEFARTVSSTTSTASGGTNSRYTSATYRSVIPHVNRTIESTNYASRYLQVVTCMENIVYGKYPASKKDGYQQCILRYIEECKNHSNNLKVVEQSVNNDMSEYKAKVSTATVDGFLQGYYDALLMVKKLLYNSKLARLQVLTNKVSR